MGKKEDEGNTQLAEKTVCDNICEIMGELGFTESTRDKDIKLCLLSLAYIITKILCDSCILGLYSHFNPYKYPDNKWILIICVVSYALLNVIHDRFDASLDHIIMRAYGGKITPISEKDAFFVKFWFPMYDDKVFLYIETGPTLPYFKEGGEFCIGDYFDSDGVIHKEPLKADIKTIINKLETQLKASKSKKD